MRGSLPKSYVWSDRAINAVGGSEMIGIKFKEENNEIILKKKLSKDETYKLNNRDKTCSLIIYKKLKEAIGYTSMCGDKKHIVLLDYDNICKWIVMEDTNRIINKFHLSPAYIFTTQEKELEKEKVGNYHVVFLDKKYPSEIVKIQGETHCDNAYKTMPLRNIYRSWVIRTSNKGKRKRPIFVEAVESENLYNEISEAHLNLLKKLYDIPNFKYTNLDGSKTLFKNIYKTGNF